MKTHLLVDQTIAMDRAGGYPSRDHEMVATLARHGLLTMPLLMGAMGTSRTVTYRRFARCEAAGLVERVAVPVVGVLLRATREGQRYVGLADLPLALLRPGAIAHELSCAELALALERDFAGDDARVLTERELRFAERAGGRPLASAPLSAHGREGIHRPDLAILAPAGTIAVERELSVKAPRRLEQIVRAWRRAEHVGEVRYYCGSAAVVRAVKRAVAATYAAEKVRIEQLPR